MTSTFYRPTHLQQWTRPSNYIGTQWEGWYPVLGQSRDSDPLERSNFRVALSLLREAESPEGVIGDEEGTASVRVAHERHFLCGWVETILVHESDEAALRAADDLAGRLQEYPILDEEDWSNLEHETAQEVWSSLSVRERGEYCGRFGISLFAARRDTLPGWNEYEGTSELIQELAS